MSDVVDGLKSVSLHGMASAWPEVTLGTARIKALDHEVVLHQLIKAQFVWLVNKQFDVGLITVTSVFLLARHFRHDAQIF